MRYAGNFHQEWGYLAPAPSLIRTARVVLVAAAVGATAGAGVVFSLVGREDTETSVAARTLARPAEAALAQLNVPPPAPAALASGAQDHAPRSLAADAPRAGAADSEFQAQFDHNGARRYCGFGRGAGGDRRRVCSSGGIAVRSRAVACRRTGQTRGLVAARFGSISGSRGAGKGYRFTGRRPRSRRGAWQQNAQQKAAAAKRRIAPRFASRAGSSRIAPGEYYMSADNYENRGRGGYYRENGWNGGYSQSGGRFQSW